MGRLLPAMFVFMINAQPTGLPQIPAPWTAPVTVAKTRAIMEEIGQVWVLGR